MQGNRGADTSPEVALRRRLHQMGLRYRVGLAPIAGFRCRPDIVFTLARVAVFVDGCFWHGCPEHGRVPKSNSGYWAAKLRRNVERDRRQDAVLSAEGWAVVRVWEHDDVHAAAARIGRLVRANRLTVRPGI
ncbi:MAG TPA: very short patch repair endonuclease [Thermoleophilaceae bacterium]|nr:very short patch repair endonuclease [Thermoleophilaceae bacterium]